MRDDEKVKFNNYILGKKLRLLHHLYEILYSFALYNNCISDERYIVHLEDEFGDCELNLKGTEMMNINEQLRLHTLLYKQLKPKSESLKLGKNGQYLFFGDLNDFK